MQLRTLRVIEARIASTGLAPSFAKLTKELGLSSVSGASRLITALDERGYIRRLPNRSRAIEVIRRPLDGSADAPHEALLARVVELEAENARMRRELAVVQDVGDLQAQEIALMMVEHGHG